MHALDLQKVEARDVFVAQEVLSEDRHRKLASIAQDLRGIRARLDALTQMAPDGEEGTACAEKTEVNPERQTASDTAARVSLASGQDPEASDQMSESDGLAAEQTSVRDGIPERQRSRLVHRTSEGSNKSQQHVHISGVVEALHPFVVMVCEEIAEALGKAISAEGLRDTLPAASSQACSGVISSREEALRGPMAEEEQASPSSDKQTTSIALSMGLTWIP